jgi:hypothetical protein
MRNLYVKSIDLIPRSDEIAEAALAEAGDFIQKVLGEAAELSGDEKK